MGTNYGVPCGIMFLHQSYYSDVRNVGIENYDAHATLKEDYMEPKKVNPSRISWGAITKNKNDY